MKKKQRKKHKIAILGTGLGKSHTLQIANQLNHQKSTRTPTKYQQERQIRILSQTLSAVQVDHLIFLRGASAGRN